MLFTVCGSQTCALALADLQAFALFRLTDLANSLAPVQFCSSAPPGHVPPCHTLPIPAGPAPCSDLSEKLMELSLAFWPP